MSPAKSLRTRRLFTAAAAMVLGLQVTPCPTALMAQSVEPTELILKEAAQPIELVSRREQRRNRRSAPKAPETTDESTEPPALIQKSPQAQQMPRRQAATQTPKTEVQMELEKLYHENGMEMPEMVDPRTSQSATNQSEAAATTNNGQVAQPGAQQPAMNQGQPQQLPQGQPQQPAATPKKKNFFTKLFSKDDAPAQPPVETPYIPPTAPALTPPAQVNNAAIPKAPGIVNYDQLFEDEVSSNSDAAVAPQQTATNTNQANNGVAAAPAQNATPARAPVANAIPQMDFNAPIEQPDLNNVNLGEAAPLTDAAGVAQAAQPAESADPFSDSALFPGSTTPPAKVAVKNEFKAPATQQATPALETPNTPAVPPEAPKAEEEPVENPYSGLTLDDNPFAKPAPRTTVSVTPRQIPLEAVKTDVLPSEASPPALVAPPSVSESSSADEEPPLVVEQKQPRRPARLAPVGSQQTRAKQEIIASRQGMTGLKGFCPVVLRDDRNLVDAQSQYRAVYNSKTYYLSSSEAVSAFHADPAKYAPAARGCDVIQLATTGEEVEGSLDYAVWYKGRLYMFSSAETMDTFVSAPSSHATLD